MPIVFLSPSTQDWNPYVTGSGSEEYWMNRIVDAMEPYLRSNGIRYRRNDPDTSAGAAIREANSGYYDFYLALHSNAIGNGSAQTSALFRPGHYRLLLSRQRRWAAGSGADRQKSAGDLPAARQGYHPPYHRTGRGVTVPVPGGAGGDRLP